MDLLYYVRVCVLHYKVRWSILPELKKIRADYLTDNGTNVIQIIGLCKFILIIIKKKKRGDFSPQFFIP